jgi:hypothetical protein
MYRVFTDHFYYGYFYRNGVLYKGSYKPMITVQEFDQIQRFLGRTGKPRPKKHTFAFTSLITCGSCGCAITATEKSKRLKTTGELKTYVFYHCTKRKKGCETCPEKRYTKVEEMEAMIILELAQYQIKSQFKTWAIEYFRNTYQEEIEKRKELIRAVLQQEAKLLQELDNLIDLRISSNITEQKYLEKKTEKDQFLIRVQDKKKDLEEGSKDWVEKISECLEFAVGAVEIFKNGDPQTQKRICYSFGWNWVLKGKKLFINKQEWLEPIKNMKELYDRHFERSEPQKTLEEFGYMATLNLFSPNLRRLRDEVRTIPPDIHTQHLKLAA